MNIQHGRQITTDSYYDGNLTSTKREYEVTFFSTRDKLLVDAVETMGVLSRGETHVLQLEIKIDDNDRVKFVKKWRV